MLIMNTLKQINTNEQVVSILLVILLFVKKNKVLNFEKHVLSIMKLSF